MTEAAPKISAELADALADPRFVALALEMRALKKPIPAAEPEVLPGEPSRNWSPATTPDEYAENCASGLEIYTERRMAKLMGISRIEFYRRKWVATLPKPVLQALLDAGIISSKALAQIARSLARDQLFANDEEHCPHCGGLLRRRRHVSPKAAATVVKALEAALSDSDGNPPCPI